MRRQHCFRSAILSHSIPVCNYNEWVQQQQQQCRRCRIICFRLKTTYEIIKTNVDGKLSYGVHHLMPTENNSTWREKNGGRNRKEQTILIFMWNFSLVWLWLLVVVNYKLHLCRSDVHDIYRNPFVFVDARITEDTSEYEHDDDRQNCETESKKKAFRVIIFIKDRNVREREAHVRLPLPFKVVPQLVSFRRRWCRDAGAMHILFPMHHSPI